jgi:hypothetical protein
MARWAPEETDTLAAMATEVVHAVGTNRTVIAVDGQRGTDLERVAAGLVRAFEAQGVPAMAAHAPATDVDALRTGLVQPFRSTGEGAGILVVHGDGVLAAENRPLWRWTLWVQRDPAADPRKTLASAALDVADPDHPRRDWADAC